MLVKLALTYVPLELSVCEIFHFILLLSQSADAVQLALKLDGSKLQGRKIRVKRSLKESENKGAKGWSGKGPAPGRERHRGRIGSLKKFSGQQRTSKVYTSFSGIKVDPNVKTKKNQAKKKVKPKKSVHIWLPFSSFFNFILERWVAFNGCHVMLRVVSCVRGWQTWTFSLD